MVKKNTPTTTKKVDQDYDVLNLNNVSLGTKETKDTNTTINPLLDDFKIIDQLAKNTAIHLGKLVNQHKILSENSLLKKETSTISKQDFNNQLPTKLDLLKKKIKPVNENSSILPTKNKLKVNQENKKWYGFGEKEITDEMRQEAQLIRLQQFLDPTKRFNRDTASEELPEHFEIGTFENNSADYYNRFTNKEKKRGTLGDILANENMLDYIDTKSTKIFNQERTKVRKSKRFFKSKK
ncbi:hypothetical protein CYY_007173 [Polysphondylium violaceum]|uniref:Fcf2 pre-rRNA processing C-terminal domain-containing protein n=1 Tax=Polysphondylium violaceum TaxID=133409 RepID=A0A8J4PQU5_9MYCE|nr:hypothetical protein CYY_007173 [Polysphondylium violaceum]